jgi:hypothetical protein
LLMIHPKSVTATLTSIILRTCGCVQPFQPVKQAFLLLRNQEIRDPDRSLVSFRELVLPNDSGHYLLERRRVEGLVLLSSESNIRMNPRTSPKVLKIITARILVIYWSFGQCCVGMRSACVQHAFTMSESSDIMLESWTLLGLGTIHQTCHNNCRNYSLLTKEVTQQSKKNDTTMMSPAPPSSIVVAHQPFKDTKQTHCDQAPASWIRRDKYII